MAAICMGVHGQDPQGEAKGLPPRTAPADYQAHAQAGAVTLAAEFKGHAVPTPQGTYFLEDYIVVEVGLFGPPGARAKVSVEEFGLRISGKRTPLPSQPYGLVLGSLTDPEWVPPVPVASKSKATVGTGGGGSELGEPPPLPPRMPIELRRAMGQRVQKAVLPEGDRALPQAGLLFFQYRGKTENIRSIELIYTGASGKAAVKIQ
jgi:hypothetical protein